MNKHVATLITSTLAASAALAQDKLDLTGDKARASYAIGADIGKSMKRQNLDLDSKALAAGVVDTFADKLALTEAELEKALNDFKTSLFQKRQTEAAVGSVAARLVGTVEGGAEPFGIGHDPARIAHDQSRAIEQDGDLTGIAVRHRVAQQIVEHDVEMHR